MENKEVEVLDGNISIDSEHFPDEKFRNYLKENFDKDGNGKLSVDM